jgi:hypothetical protein
MFSGSNAYMGGNSGRGPPQYGNSFNPQGQQQQQQQQFQPQQTGFGQAPLQQQFTGFPMQAQQTGFGQAAQQQPQFNSFQGNQPGQYGQPPMPPMPPMPQNTQQQLQTPAPVQQPQPTGFSQMTASFQSSAPAAKPKGRRPPKASKIPNIRLSFITVKDQAQFETLFKSAAGDEQSLSGDKSRDILLRSNLDGNSLSQIWYEWKLAKVTSFILIALQDPCRYHEIRPASFPRICLSHVSVQFEAYGQTAPFDSP